MCLCPDSTKLPMSQTHQVRASFLIHWHNNDHNWTLKFNDIFISRSFELPDCHIHSDQSSILNKRKKPYRKWQQRLLHTHCVHTCWIRPHGRQWLGWGWKRGELSKQANGWWLRQRAESHRRGGLSWAAVQSLRRCPSIWTFGDGKIYPGTVPPSSFWLAGKSNLHEISCFSPLIVWFIPNIRGLCCVGWSILQACMKLFSKCMKRWLPVYSFF